MSELRRRVQRAEDIVAAAQDAEDAAGIASLTAAVAQWEAEHGPVTPRSPESLGFYPGHSEAWDGAMDGLTDEELVSMTKYTLIND